MRNHVASLALALGLLVAGGAAAQELIGPYDTDGNGKLNAEELTPFMRERHPRALAARSAEAAQAAAENAALVFVTLVPGQAETETPEAQGTLQEVEARLMRFLASEQAALEGEQRAAAEKKAAARTHGFFISRTLEDAVSLSKWDVERPFIVSYKHDELSKKDRDQINLLGSAGYDFGNRDIDRDHLGFQTIHAAIGTDLDIDGTKKAAETTVGLSAPVQAMWIFRGSGRAINGLSLNFTPSYTTDRKGHKAIYSAEAKLSVASRKAAIGFPLLSSPNNPAVSFQWLPSLSIGAVRVEDAAGDEDLLAVEGETQTRLTARAKATLRFPRVSQRLSLGADYRVVHDPGEHTLGYGELTLSYQASDIVQVVAAYRRGARGAELKKTDDILLGIGLLRERP